MSNWQEFREKEGRLSVWPYPIRYEKEQEIETDILVLGGGIAGCWGSHQRRPEGCQSYPGGKIGNGKKRSGWAWL